jgi:hypothetical protein
LLIVLDHLVLVAFFVNTFHIVISWGQHLFVLHVAFLEFALSASFATNFLDAFFIK